MSGPRRIIAGASGSPGSLCALRYAGDLARASDATLMRVLCWIPPGSEIADLRAPCPCLRRIWADDARQRLQQELEAAWGQFPASPAARSAATAWHTPAAPSWPSRHPKSPGTTRLAGHYAIAR